MKALNLYAGVGGNRKNWPDNVQVTAVEINPKIARVYRRLYPNDILIEGDAHQYLVDHANEFDFIWSSRPCQTHTRMMKFTRHKLKKFPDFGLYEEIVFLQHFFNGKWVVENVVPYYTPLIPATKILGRHMFWSNFDFEDFDVKRPDNFINLANLKGKQSLMDWLGIHYEENIYYEGNHCPAQVLRNCVHPKLGNHILEAATSVGEPCNVCGSKDHVCTPDIPGLRHCPYTSSSETLLRPQATTAENSHSQNPDINHVSGTGGDMDGE